VNLSVLVTTYNQESNIGRCLDSVAGWASDIWVLDSFSTDRTLEIVRCTPVQVRQRPFDDFAANKNWALDYLPWRHEWILILDADETAPAALREEVDRLLEKDGAGYAGFYVNRRVYFLGRWLRHCGWYPNWNLRLFRRKFGRYENRKVHEHLLVQGNGGMIEMFSQTENDRARAERFAGSFSGADFHASAAGETGIGLDQVHLSKMFQIHRRGDRGRRRGQNAGFADRTHDTIRCQKDMLEERDRDDDKKTNGQRGVRNPKNPVQFHRLLSFISDCGHSFRRQITGRAPDFERRKIPGNARALHEKTADAKRHQRP